ncbi:WD40 repeat domain-containing protein [Emticicia sp. SJ17W-69]|uniref:YncE family protein n=1 Tax=Emticicia sp. SJ17W-69 TaxID=3421657 RepID=UPI003EB7B661
MKKLLFSILFIGNFTAFSQKLSFDAKAVIAISDADMAASAYIDGKLLKEKGSKDALSVIKFPIEKYSEEIKTISVSNSVLNWTKGMVLSKNNHIAYVVETRGTQADNVTEFKNLHTDFPLGGFISVVDISDLSQPKVLYKFPTGKNPIAVDISPDGEYLIICSEEEEKELQVLELDSTGKPIRIINKPKDFPTGRITDVSWHPNNNFIAFTLEDSKEVGLIKVTRDGPTGKIVRMDLAGHPLKVGKFPGAGQFSPDGKYYIVPDLKWGDDAKAEQGYDGKGDMFVIKFNFEGTGDHFLITRAKVGENPEGFAISPDGSMIVVANIKKTHYPWENAEFSKNASLSLLTLNADGTLTNAGEFDFEGILPQNILFDKNGDNIAVTVFDYFNYGKHIGGIDFWKVNKGAKPSLQKQDFKLFLPHGCHAFRLIK